MTFLGDVSNVGKNNRECAGEDAADGDHSKKPPSVDAHKGDGGTGERDRNEEEKLAAPDVGEGADQRGRQKR